MDARHIPHEAVSRVSFALRPKNDRHSDRVQPLCLIATNDDALNATAHLAVRQLACSTAFVRSGHEAITTVRSHPTHIALVDQSLPDVPGIDVVRAIEHDSHRPAFVLTGTDLTTRTTVEAMKLGALTVLEKPLSLADIVGTIRAALFGHRTTERPASSNGAGASNPRSASERWALHVLKACESEGDLKTLSSWASFAGVSYSSLCESCRLVGIQPLNARNLARVLRAVVQSRRHNCRLEELLDISDRRTLKVLMTAAGLGQHTDSRPISVQRFLESQRFVPARHAGLSILRAFLIP